MVASSGGYLSIVATDTGATFIVRDIAGNEVRRQEQAIGLDLHSLRGIGMGDGGYLVAGSMIA